jgi:hypothetical protein
MRAAPPCYDSTAGLSKAGVIVNPVSSPPPHCLFSIAVSASWVWLNAPRRSVCCPYAHPSFTMPVCDQKCTRATSAVVGRKLNRSAIDASPSPVLVVGIVTSSRSPPCAA